MVGARFISLAGVVVYEMMGTYMYIDVYGGRGFAADNYWWNFAL